MLSPTTVAWSCEALGVITRVPRLNRLPGGDTRRGLPPMSANTAATVALTAPLRTTWPPTLVTPTVELAGTVHVPLKTVLPPVTSVKLEAVRNSTLRSLDSATEVSEAPR